MQVWPPSRLVRARTRGHVLDLNLKPLRSDPQRRTTMMRLMIGLADNVVAGLTRKFATLKLGVLPALLHDRVTSRGQFYVKLII